MGWFGRATAAVVLAATVVGVAACGVPETRQVGTLPIGVDSLDGSLKVWPGRGDMIRDVGARTGVSEAVAAWRTPAGDRARLATSGIVWLGEVDGRTTSLVIADVPHWAATWLIQLEGIGDQVRVTRASQYTDTGYLAYSDVLPLRVGVGSRYVVSERVDTLISGAGEVVLTNGLSDEVAVPECELSPLSVRVRPTETLARGRTRLLFDLGRAVSDPRYPLMIDDRGNAPRILSGLDICELSGSSGPFGSLEPKPAPESPPPPYEQVPLSWPAGSLTEARIATLPPLLGDTDLMRMQWRGAGGTMRAVIYRPPDGDPVVSRADGSNRIQVFEIPIAGERYLVVQWSPSARFTMPDDMEPVFSKSGLMIVPVPTRPITFTAELPDDEEPYEREIIP